MTIFNSTAVSINSLLSTDNHANEQKYFIPPYQRPYIWKDEQWEELIEDIIQNEPGYFIGSILLIKRNTSGSNIQNYEVVDGQQRLVTISVFLIAIYKNLIVQIIKKPNSSARIFEFESNLRKLISGSFSEPIQRLQLSTQNKNDSDYNTLFNNLIQIDNFRNIDDDETEETSNPEIVTSEKLADIEELFKKSNFSKKSSIYPVYEYYNKEIEKLISGKTIKEKIETLENIFKKLKTTLIIKIDVEDESSAYNIFESLNNRGTPLSPIDLIKNTFINEIIKSQNNNPAPNTTSTINAESINNDWQVITTYLSSSEDQFRFLKHYYYAFKFDKNNDKYNIIISKANIIKTYLDLIKSEEKKQILFADIVSKSKIYSLLINPKNIDDDENNILYSANYKKYLMGLERIKGAPVYSLLLYILSTYPDENITKLIRYLELWFSRRHLTKNPKANELDKIFIEIIEKCKASTNLNVDKIIVILNSYFTPTSKKDFIDYFAKLPLFSENKESTRVVLNRLEESYRTEEERVDFWETTSKNRLVWSIEHILPQSLNGSETHPDLTYWRGIWNDESIYEHHLHTLGNLTLSASDYNKKLKRLPFKDKCELVDIAGKQIGLLNTVKINTYCKQKYTNGSYDWEQNDILKRGSILASKFAEIFEEFNSEEGSMFTSE